MLTWELRHEIDDPVEVFGTSPHRLQGLSLESVQRTRVHVGGRPVAAGELFLVSGSSADREQLWTGELARVSGIGADMQGGWIRIEGNAGDFTGARMNDGTIHASGNSGDFAGGEMIGGLIHVRGNIGSSAGSALPGSSTGMRGGLMLVEGNAGSCLGQQMRRGTIAVRGNAGNCCAYLMRAGTIVAGGRVGKNVGAEMVRGTVFAGELAEPAPRGFACGGVLDMAVARLVGRYLAATGMPLTLLERNAFLAFHGDRVQGSRGELFVATPE